MTTGFELSAPAALKVPMQSDYRPMQYGDSDDGRKNVRRIQQEIEDRERREEERLNNVLRRLDLSESDEGGRVEMI